MSALDIVAAFLTFDFAVACLVALLVTSGQVTIHARKPTRKPADRTAAKERP